MATPLEGVVRNDSIHAAAVVIGDRPLTEYLPLQQKGTDSEVVTQFSMDDVDALGLLKMDFLGLRNLDVIDRAVEVIEQSPRRAARHGRAAARRPPDLRDDGAGRRHGRLPVRVVRHARRAAPGEADRVRGPDRAERAVPAGADAVHPRLRAQQGRPGPGHVRGRAPAHAARGHPRHLHLPGAVHGDREGRGRVHARRGRRSAQGDRQEGRDPDGRRSRRSSSTAAPATGRPRRSGGRCGPRSRWPPTTPSTRPTPPATR